MNLKLRFVIPSAIALTMAAAIGGLFLWQARPAGATPSPLFPVYTTGSFTFASGQEMIRPPITATPGVTLLDQEVEPEIKVDLFGTIYITSIHGVPGGVDLWKSTDNGATFAFLGEPDGAQDKCNVAGTLPCTAGAGGGDDSIDVSTGGYLYVSSLYLAGLTTSTSYDGGIGGALPGQKWEVNPAAAGVPSDDRQWIAAYGPQTVGMTYNATALTRPPGGIGLFFVKSTDAGKTFGPPVEITAATATDETNVQGNLVVDPYTGNWFTCYIPSGLNNVVRLASSTDGGTTWRVTTAYTGPAGTTNRGVFPIMSMDRGGNLHMVFSKSDDNANHTNSHVFLISSANPSAAAPTWTSAVQIDNNGTNTGTALLAWPAAGSPGVVDITWIGSSGTSTNTPPFDWHVYFAQVTNALSGSPTITSNQITGQIHNATVCVNGLGCATGTRDMAEYYTMTLGPDGRANIAYEDSINGICGTQSNCTAHTWFTKQTGGPSAFAPPPGPAPATFAANLSMPSSGGFAEPNSWVDSHNCIYGGSINGGNSRTYRSQNGGLTFTALDLPLSPSSVGSGGDMDIVTLPKADGSRFDQIYAVDLDNGDFKVLVWKSTDGGASYIAPGAGGSAGVITNVSSDRMWLWGDRGVPTAADQTVYLMDHEVASEDIRFEALTNDVAWSPATSGITDPDLILPPNSTFPNTNPGHVFVNKGGAFNHMVYGVFGAGTFTTDASAPPFGKMPNLWESVGAPPAAAGAPPGPFTNYPVFKGVIDSPAQAPSPAPSIPAGVATYGSHIGLLFPWAASDSAGNVYAVWATPSGRLNTVQTGTSNRSNTFDVWFASSTDGGKNFYGPWRVSSGVGTSIFPGIAAGDDGRVVISWYQSNNVGAPMVASNGTITGGPTTIPAGSPWNVMFAQSINANSREPVFTVTQASDHPIHTGGICVNGLLCLLGGDRSLADFFQTSIGPDGMAHIFSADNGTSSVHVNYMRQTGGPASLANPTFPTCLGNIPLTGVVSRKVHGGAGTFDIDMPLAGARGVECRGSGSVNDYTLVFKFPNLLTSVGGASVTAHNPTSGTGSVSSSMIDPSDHHNYIVNLTNVSTGQYLTVTLTSVNDGVNNVTNVVGPQMGVLVGDASGNGVVTNADVSVVKAQVASGGVVTSSNFRTDINANGAGTNADVSLVKAQVAAGAQLPTTP